MTDEAKAVAALAETTGKAVDALSGFGGYVREVLGDLPRDAVGLIGDRIKERRIANVERRAAEAGRILRYVDPIRLSAPSPSIIIPLIEASKDEERKELQDLWARLLANATIDGGQKIRREFFATVAQMEPLDAIVFSEGCEWQSASGRNLMQDAFLEHLGPKVPNSWLDGFRVSVDALVALRCCETNGAGAYIAIYGRALWRALKIE